MRPLGCLITITALLLLSATTAQADPAFRSLSSTTYASRTNTVITAPTGIVDGDVLILMFIAGATPTPPTPTLPAGFTLIQGGSSVTDVDGFTVTRYLAWKLAASESGSYTVTHAAGSSQGLIVCVSGGDPSATPLSTNAGSLVGGDAFAIAPSLTTTRDHTFVLVLAHNWDLYGTATPPSGTTPTWTERYDDATSLIYAASGVLSPAGATGATSVPTLSVAGTSRWGAFQVAVQPPTPPPVLVTSDGASGFVSDDFTETGGVDTTGATLLVGTCSWTPGTTAAATPSDSFGNAWTGLTAQVDGTAQVKVQIFYVNSGTPTVGAAHTFRCTAVSGFAVATLHAFSGTGVSPFDQQTGAVGGTTATTQATGSITPTQDGEAIVAAIAGWSGASTFTIGQGLTVSFVADFSPGNTIGGGSARLLQTPAAAINPIWSWTGTETVMAAAVASFKAGAHVIAGGASLTLLDVGR